VSVGPLTVFLAALATALATGLGALPFIGVRAVSSRAVAYANAVASGLMLGASFGLVAEGTRHGSAQSVVGAALGVVAILVADRVLRSRGVPAGASPGLGGRRALLLMIVMTAHSFAEGVAVGVSFGGTATLALVITVAIAIHNIPEGLAISAVLRPQGASIAVCAWWSVVSSLPQPMMAVPAYLFVGAFAPALPYGLGFAAGAMAFMVLVELLPEAYDQAEKHAVAAIVSVTLVGMVLLQRVLG
jgi:zinc transporter ZupT